MGSFLRTSWNYVLLPLLVAITIFYVLQSPRYSGVQLLPNKYNPITIRRDQYGVPSIESKTLKDTFYGLGYAQAQDRLWALYTRKFLVAGRVSEIAGEKTLPIDKFFRNIGMRRYCEYALEYLDSESLALYQAFADGINDYAASATMLPLEFWLTWSQFEKFTVLDTLVSAKFVAFFLTFDFQFEFIFDTLSDAVGPKMAAELLPYKGEDYLWNDVVVMNDDELKQAGIFEKYDQNKRYSELTGFEFPEERRPPKSSINIQNQSTGNVNQQAPPPEVKRETASDRQRASNPSNTAQGAATSTNQATGATSAQPSTEGQKPSPPNQSTGTASSTQAPPPEVKRETASDRQRASNPSNTAQGAATSTNQATGATSAQTSTEGQKSSPPNQSTGTASSTQAPPPEIKRETASDRQRTSNPSNTAQGAATSTNQATGATSAQTSTEGQKPLPPNQSTGTASSTQAQSPEIKTGTASDRSQHKGRTADPSVQQATNSANQATGARQASTEGQKTGSAAEQKAVGENVNLVMPEAQTGSNSWVVHGDHTTTGKPILANDPHLMNGIPTVWYPVSLFYEGGYASGVSMVGFPGIQIGKTAYASWAMTTLCSDTGDLYTLKTKDNNYFYENEWHPMKEFKEVIKVKGQKDPVEITTYETHHGVVLDFYYSEIFITRTFRPKEDQRYSLAWPGFQKKDGAFKSFFNMMAAKNSQDMVDAWEHALEPAFSLLFATTQGDIGFVGIGRIPIRRNPLSGIRPQDGSLKENDWLGYVPWSEHPKIVNPKKGYIVSANNKMATDNIKWSTSSTLFPTSRAARIDEMILEYLNKGQKISVDNMITMQGDTLDVLAREVVPIMISRTKDALQEGYPLSVSNEKLNHLLQNLTEWDYVTGRESIPASIFNVWERFFVRTMLQKLNLNSTDIPRLISGAKFDHFLYRKVLEWGRSIPREHNIWCQNDKNAQFQDPCLYNLVQSLEEAHKYLSNEFGGDMDDWQWGRVHKMDYPHGTFSITPLRPLFHRSTPAQGNGRTANVARMKMETDSFAGVWSANMKMVASLKEGDSSYIIVDTGVSGNLFSPHYDDQMHLLVDGKYLEIVEEIDKNAKGHSISKV